jgi:hypothetical protein
MTTQNSPIFNLGKTLTTRRLEAPEPAWSKPFFSVACPMTEERKTALRQQHSSLAAVQRAKPAIRMPRLSTRPWAAAAEETTGGLC